MPKLSRKPAATTPITPDSSEPVDETETPPAYNPTTPFDADTAPVGDEATTPPLPEELVGQPESTVEAARAEQTNQRAYRAARDARARSLAAQQGENRGAVVDVKAADEEAVEARREVLDRERAHRKPGVYVRSPILCQDDTGQRLRTPVGMRLTETMIQKLGDGEIRKLVRMRRLEDLR